MASLRSRGYWPVGGVTIRTTHTGSIGTGSSSHRALGSRTAGAAAGELTGSVVEAAVARALIDDALALRLNRDDGAIIDHRT